MKQKINQSRKIKNVNTCKKISLAVMAAVISFSAMAQVNTPMQKTITVNGSAEAEVTPDEIYVQVELREYDKKGAGKIDIATIKNKFLEACKSIGLTEADVTVQGFGGNDYNTWWYKKNKKQNPDLKANITYQVKVGSVKKMDELVDKLDDEATQNFFIAKSAYSKIAELKKQLKIQAIKAAKEKADYLAAAINEQVGGAITINDPNEINFEPQPRMYANTLMKADVAGDAAPMNVDFKKLKLQFEVNVVFALK